MTAERVTLDQMKEDLWTGDATSTARAIMQSLKVNKAAIEVLLPAVANAVLATERNRSRSIEYMASREGGMTNAHARSLVMAESFAIGGGKFVTWGAATVEQHLTRVSLLIAHRDGVNATIARHEEAVAAIRAAGVDCLDQIAAAA